MSKLVQIRWHLMLATVIFAIITISYPKSEQNMAASASISDKISIKNNDLADKMLILQPRLKKDTAEVYEFLIKKHCDQDAHDVMVAILHGESSLNHLSVNSKGDFGLGQINHYTWGKEFQLTKEELLNPIVNIKYSCKILKLAKKAHPDDNTYWSYYHNRKQNVREKYIKKINSILQKIKDR